MTDDRQDRHLEEQLDDLGLGAEPASPEQLLRMARAVLAVGYRDLVPTPTSQLALGWLRGAHDQIAAMAELMLAGRRSATGPNARATAELTIRIMWLYELDDRTSAMPALVEQEGRLAKKHVVHSADMGFDVEIDPLYKDLDLTQFGPLDSALNSQARGVLNAAKAAGNAAAVYQLWRDATQYAHATTRFAGMWAPTLSGRFVESETSPDWSGMLHLISPLSCAMAGQILIDEGTPQDRAGQFVAAAIGGLLQG